MANYNAWHRSAYYWAEPDIFNPDHFLEEGKLINDKEGFPVCISTATPASSAIQTPLRRSTRPARRPNLGRQNYSQNIGCPSYLWFQEKILLLITLTLDQIRVQVVKFEKN